MTENSNNLSDIIKIIQNNNNIEVKLPQSKETISVKRLNLKSISELSPIIAQGDSNKIIIDYNKFLIKNVKSRVNRDISYLDYYTTAITLRSAENSTYKDMNLKEIINNLNIDSLKHKTEETIIEDNITFHIKFELPNIDRLQGIINKVNTSESSDLLFFSVFKYIKQIEIISKDSKSLVNSIGDLKTIYDIISYKVLNKISIITSSIEKELYSLFKVNIETDTSFLYSI